MESKYYTPALEEFHKGFDFEYHNNTTEEWCPATLGANNTPNLILWLTEIMGDPEKFRVKHLDHEDIEEEGFEFRETNHMRYWYDFKAYVENRQGGYKVHSCELIHDPDQEIVIIKMIIEGDEEKMFDGIVRNKSELKKILGQLSITKPTVSSNERR